MFTGRYDKTDLFSLFVMFLLFHVSCKVLITWGESIQFIPENRKFTLKLLFNWWLYGQDNRWSNSNIDDDGLFAYQEQFDPSLIIQHYSMMKNHS